MSGKLVYSNTIASDGGGAVVCGVFSLAWTVIVRVRSMIRLMLNWYLLALRARNSNPTQPVSKAILGMKGHQQPSQRVDSLGKALSFGPQPSAYAFFESDVWRSSEVLRINVTPLWILSFLTLFPNSFGSVSNKIGTKGPSPEVPRFFLAAKC